MLHSLVAMTGWDSKLIAKPRLLWLSDEIYEMLQSVINDKSGNKEKIMKMLLTLFTSAADDYSVRAKAGTTATFIHCPHLTLFGACTPEGFFTSINERIIGHGLFARMELFPCESIPDPRIPSGLDKIPVEIEHHAMQWKNYTPPRSGNLNFDAKKIIPSDTVMSLLQEYQLEAHRKKKKLQQSAAPDWQIALWSRAFDAHLFLRRESNKSHFRLSSASVAGPNSLFSAVSIWGLDLILK